MAATPSEPSASRPAPPDVVVPLTRADLPAAAAVLAAALADDPGFRHLFPVDSRRERELRALYRMTLSDALAHGHTYVTKLDGVVTGAVALYAPGTYPMTTGRWWRQALRIVAIAVRTRTHSLGLIKFGDATAEGVPADAWYVEALGVRPDLQRAGRGKLLMARVFELIDAGAEPGYLETTQPPNVEYYSALGYTETNARVAIAQDGPWIIPMERARKG